MSDVESPFRDPKRPPLLFHSCHHKCGTHWFKNVLNRVARRFGLAFSVFEPSSPIPGAGILFDQQSRIDTALLPEYRGSHMIRDPRDVVVSGYFYHLWTPEAWVHDPRDQYNGLTYQQYLKSLSREDGLIAEIATCGFVFKQMLRWNDRDPRILELKFEDCFSDPASSFTSLFRHYGFTEDAIEVSLAIADTCRFESVAKRRPGVVREGQVTRSGQPGQWKEHFTQRVKESFREQTGDLLQELNYETCHE